MKWLVRWTSYGQMEVEADSEEEAKEFILTMDEDRIRLHEDDFEIEADEITEEDE